MTNQIKPVTLLHNGQLWSNYGAAAFAEASFMVFPNTFSVSGDSCSGKTALFNAMLEIDKELRGGELQAASSGSLMRELAEQAGFHGEDRFLDFVKHMRDNPQLGYDDQADGRMRRFLSYNNRLGEGRLAGVMGPRAFKIWLDCPYPVRAARRQKEAKYQHLTVDKVETDLVDRDRSDWVERFMLKYPECRWSPSAYDLVLSSEFKNPRQLAEEVFAVHAEWLANHREQGQVSRAVFQPFWQETA